MSANFTEVMSFVKKLEGVASDRAAASALGLTSGDFSNRKKRESLPYERLIDWASRRGVSLDVLLLKRVPAADTGNFVTPPLWDGSTQPSLAVDPKWLGSQGVDPADVRIMEVTDQEFPTPTGLLKGDWALFDASQTEMKSSGLYALRWDPGPPVMRQAQVSGQSVNIFVDPGGQNYVPFNPEEMTVLGRVFARLGAV